MESLIVFLFVISCSVALQQDVQAKFGEDVTLQCQITTDERISVVKWSRPDLNTDGYVYFYRNKRFYENYQHPSFHGRVKLRHPEMKDGDVSIILKNVTFNDTGMYECHIAVRNPVRSKRAHTEISLFIDLTVTGETRNSMFEQPMTEGEHGGGNMHFVQEEETPTVLMVVPAVVAAAVLVVTIGGSVLLRTFKRKKQQTPEATTADLKCPAAKI
ncbi:sodium channel subunit beta-3-like isoform X2 [Pundamilia nyererei]|uniref:Sodium channel subunit beta-3-like isoform X2 n=1 Tax=Pundamilia nyererei TaxID=303518 RepID=A0A9Y3S3N0_9CICH|nr:PREDICTED: sodium channel subunit beta-3-like isoform X2 [Pundamilia nyererei]